MAPNDPMREARQGSRRPRFPPLPGELGKRIYESVSKEAWQGWLKQQTMLINENRLNMADPRARQYLMKQTEKYFFGDGADQRPATCRRRKADRHHSRRPARRSLRGKTNGTVSSHGAACLCIRIDAMRHGRGIRYRQADRFKPPASACRDPPAAGPHPGRGVNGSAFRTPFGRVAAFGRRQFVRAIPVRFSSASMHKSDTSA